jgi:hypothetical protein
MITGLVLFGPLSPSLWGRHLCCSLEVPSHPPILASQ